MLDGSSIQGSVRMEESDQYLRPDPDTFAILPWRPQCGRVARRDPRNILKRLFSA